MLCLNAGTKYFQRVLVALSTMSVLLWVEVEFVGAECGWKEERMDGVHVYL
jgi:hypothetical protein